MPITRKYFRSPFIVEKSKLTRLLEVIDAKFEKDDLPTHHEFEVHLHGQKVIETTSIEHVFALDNSQKSRIERLSLSSTSNDRAAESSHRAPSRALLAEFDGQGRASITLVVKGDDSTWVSEAFSAAEEQIERTLERSIFTRLSYNQTAVFSLFAIAVILGVSLTFAATSSIAPTQLTNSMWLTDTDLQELQPVQPDGSLTKEKAAEVVTRQIHNVTDFRKRRQSLLARATQPRFILIVVPTLIVFAAFAYVYYKCYPHAVFLWGDTEDWYKKILSQRRFIWSSIIIALAVGILANLFLLGLRS
jgi:hypothetical protein